MFVYGYRILKNAKKNRSRGYIYLAPATFRIQRNLPENTEEILLFQFYATFEKNCSCQKFLKPLDQFV